MEIPSTNLDALQSFGVFADSLNFSEAARQLHISQPALHAKIRKLGEQLGVSLYARRGKVLVLTAEGVQVARHGRELIALNKRFVKGLASGQDEVGVTLVAGEGAYLHLLGKALSGFRQRHAKVSLQLLTGDRDASVKMVRSGDAQIGVAPLGSVPKDLRAIPLTSVGQTLIVPRGHLLARRKRLRMRDLEGLSLVVPPEGRPHRELLERLLQADGVHWQPSLEASGWELMMRFAQLGFGMTVVNACCPAPRGMVSVPLIGYPTLAYHLFYAADREPTEHVRRLIELLVAHAEYWRSALSLPHWR